MGAASSASPTSRFTPTLLTVELGRSCHAPRGRSARVRSRPVPSCWSPCSSSTSPSLRTRRAASSTRSTPNAERSRRSRRGSVLCQIQAYQPVIESFGFIGDLRGNTGGQAFPQMKFSHWKIVSGDPYKEGSMANGYLADIRKRKGMKDALPVFEDYYDKI